MEVDAADPRADFHRPFRSLGGVFSPTNSVVRWTRWASFLPTIVRYRRASGARYPETIGPGPAVLNRRSSARMRDRAHVDVSKPRSLAACCAAVSSSLLNRTRRVFARTWSEFFGGRPFRPGFSGSGGVVSFGLRGGIYELYTVAHKLGG